MYIGEEMNVLLIQAFGNPNATLYRRFIEKIWLLWPSCTLDQLAAVTPSNHDITKISYINDSRFKSIDFSEYDLVGISYFTSTSYLAYKIADKIREQKIPVVLGGYHASAMPEEAKQHADSVVVGEAELSWPMLLNDLIKKGKLEPFYIQNNSIPSEYLPCVAGSSINYTVGGIEATRGCVNHCEFCAISNSYMGSRLRLKPIKSVIETIEAMSQNYFIFMDSSLSLVPSYSKKLFKELKKLDKKFACFFNANVVDDEELIKLASDAGCIACSIGFETVHQPTIDFLHKKTNNVNRYKYIVKKLHDYNIAIVSSMAFGFDYDTPDVFDVTFEKLKEWEVDSTGANILTPLPGTALYSRLESEGRILTKDWSKYDLYHVVFQPRNMTVEELYNGTKRFVRRFYSFPNSMLRILSSMRLGWHPFLGVLEHNISSKILYGDIFRSTKSLSLKTSI